MRTQIRLKLRIFSGLLLAFGLLLIVRLYFVQIVHGEEFSMKAETQYENGNALYDRGAIYFTRVDGTLMSAAALATGFTLAIDPRRIQNAEEVYQAFNAITPIDRESFFASAEKKGDPYEMIAQHISQADGEALAARKLPGVITERTRWRVYPAGERAAQSLGFVAYDEQDALSGRYGLERYYESVLKRTNEGIFSNFFAELFVNIDEATSDGRTAREGDVITTIEPLVQERLEQVLAEVNASYASRMTGGIIMDPSTGEIVALGTYPSFDPNVFRASDPAHFGNPLVEHVYEFGSIMKSLTMAVGLDSGAVSPSTMYEDTGCTTMSTKRFCNHDLKARGMTPMQDVLSYSLNLGAAFIARQVGQKAFRDYFTRLGFGTETGIDLPSEVRGQIKNLDGAVEVEFATASFGQGIAISPIEMVRALGVLANKGELVTPHLARAIKLESGLTKELSWGDPEPVLSPLAVEETTRMLVTVVDEALAGGTVKMPDMSIAAKTGTAQVPSPEGGYATGKYFHSFFGYFPAFSPRFIILLYTREPQGVQYASETLTHPFMDLAQFLISYYDIPPDRATYDEVAS